MKRGRNSNEEANDGRQQKCERKDDRIDLDRAHARKIRWAERDERGDANFRDDDGEYEEIVAIRHKKDGLLHWLLWRSPDDAIVLQPIMGRSKRFASVSEAIETLNRFRAS